jgi:hypothetical protein
MDIQGNEQADKLAKLATTIEPSSTTTSFAVLSANAKKASITELKSALEAYDKKASTSIHSYKMLFPGKINSKIQLPCGTPRKLASALYQLKLGHGYIKPYLYKVGHTTSNKCECGAI